jgi:hypothetical protein
MSSSQLNNRTRVVSLSDEDQAKEILVKAVLGLWDVVNDLTRLRPSKRKRADEIAASAVFREATFFAGGRVDRNRST